MDQIHDSNELMKQLAESQERFNLVTSGSNSGFWDWNVLTDEVWYSPRFKEMLGYQNDEFPHLLSSFSNNLHPDDLDLVIDKVKFHHENRTPYNVEYRLKTKDGKYLWFHASGASLWNEQGKPYRMAGLIQEITDRKIAEDQLKISEKRFRTSFENAPIGIALVSTDGKWLDVNTSLCEMIGYSKEELLNIDFQTITHPEDLDTDLDLLHQILDDKIQTYEMNKRYYHKDGRIIWIQLNVSLVRDESAVPLYFVSQIQNITKRIQNEQEREILNSTLVERTEELSISNRELEVFAYAASHDLQEPLRTVINYLSLLKRKSDNVLNEGQTQYIDNAIIASSRMRVLINDLLTYSRITTRQNEMEMIDLNMVLQETLSNLDSVIHETQAKIQSMDLPVLKGDKTQFTLLFQNLINNAIKYCDKSTPAVKIEVQSDHKQWIFLVKDNGIGIDQKFKDRIFTIFQRLHTREEYEGTGVGLALCKKIIERHNGKIWVESELNNGSTFYFTLPIVEKL